MGKLSRAGLSGLYAGAGLTFSLLAASAAHAGGFAPKEHSTVFFGTVYAGSAAGGALSSAFWNPAAFGQFDGVNSESAYTLIMPNSEVTTTGGFLDAASTNNSSGDIGDTAILPASYFSYQLNEKIVLGMSINAPFGLVTDGAFDWDGSLLARESKITTYNFAPTVAYRVSPMLTVGAGLQIQYIDAQLRQAFGTADGPTSAIKGDDWALGFTAGVLLTPREGTSIGLGFRSKLDHKLDGTFHVAGMPGIRDGVTAGVELPEQATLSLRQRIAPTWTFLATVEWTNWSRLENLDVRCDNGIGFVCAPGGTLGGAPLTLNWEDGWFYSIGLEHEYTDRLTLRGGVAYEKSPIQSAEGRTIRVPDADRIWLGLGASYKWSEWTTIDFAYSHLFVEDSRTSQELFNTGNTLEGDVEAHADAISIGFRSKLDWLFDREAAEYTALK